MVPYEAGIVYRPELEGEALDQSIERAARVIREHGGEPGTPDKWGKRHLAYEIQHVHEGVYVFLPFKAPGTVVRELERHLRLADDVLRYLVVAPPEEPPAKPVAEVAGAAAGAEGAQVAPEGAAVASESAPVAEPAPVAESAPAPAAEEPAPNPEAATAG